MRFLGRCNRCFCDVAVLLLEMLQYIIFDVAVHNFRCCSTFFSMLHYIVLRYCSIYIPMLHYIVFLYVCNVALEVFHALLGQGHGGGTGLHWGTGTGAQRGAEDSARSVTRGASGGSVLFTRGGRAGLGKGPASDALARRTSGR